MVDKHLIKMYLASQSNSMYNAMISNWMNNLFTFKDTDKNLDYSSSNKNNSLELKSPSKVLIN